jgi:hypothetical protein
MNLDRLAQLGKFSLEQAGLESESVALVEAMRIQVRTISLCLQNPAVFRRASLKHFHETSTALDQPERAGRFTSFA